MYVASDEKRIRNDVTLLVVDRSGGKHSISRVCNSITDDLSGLARRVERILW